MRCFLPFRLFSRSYAIMQIHTADRPSSIRQEVTTVRNKLKRPICILYALIIFFTCAAPCFAVKRTNPETPYMAVVVDAAGLLADSEEAKLLDEMMPITEYANIAVYTVDTPTSLKDYERAREKRQELFGDSDSAVFMIDMYLRRVIIQRKGNMEKFFNNSMANNITNNVAKYAHKEQYYKTCSVAISQMADVINERNIPSPMKYMSNFSIAFILSLVLIFRIALLLSSNLKKTEWTDKEETMESDVEVLRIKKIMLLSDTVSRAPKYTSDSSSSYGGSSYGGSSCGGSSCGGSSGGGSSCGGSSF